MTDETIGTLNIEVDASKATETVKQFSGELDKTAKRAKKAEENLKSLMKTVEQINKVIKTLPKGFDDLQRASNIKGSTVKPIKSVKPSKGVTSSETIEFEIDYNNSGSAALNEDLKLIRLNAVEASSAVEQLNSEVSKTGKMIIVQPSTDSKGLEESTDATEKQVEANEKLEESNSNVHASMLPVTIAVVKNREAIVSATGAMTGLVNTLTITNKITMLSAAFNGLNTIAAILKVTGDYLIAGIITLGKAMASMIAKVFSFIRSIDLSNVSLTAFIGLLKASTAWVVNFLTSLSVSKIITFFTSIPTLAVKGFKKLKESLSDVKRSVKQSYSDSLVKAREVTGKFKTEVNQTAVESANLEKRLGGLVLKYGLLATAAVGVGLGIGKAVDSFNAIVTTGSDFQQSMADVLSVKSSEIDITAPEGIATFEALKNKAREMGAATAYSAKEAGEAMYYMGVAGMKAEDMIKGVPDVLNLAASSGMELGRSSDVATDLMAAFGKTAADLPAVVDTLAYVSSNAATSVEQFYEAAKYAAPVGTALGVSMEEMSAAIGIMADQGTKGSSAGTALRASLIRLASTPSTVRSAFNELKDMKMFDESIQSADDLGKAAEESQEAIKDLGIQVEDASTGKMRPMNDILTDLASSMKNYSDIEKSATLSQIFGQEAVSGMMALMKSLESGEKSLSDFTGQISDAAGTAQEMADIRMDTLQGDIATYNSALSELQITIFTAIEPALRSLVQMSTGSINSITSFLKFFGNALLIVNNQLQPLYNIISAILSPIILLYNIVTSVTKAFIKLSAIFVQFSLIGFVQQLEAVSTISNQLKQELALAFKPLTDAIAPIVNYLNALVKQFTNVADSNKEARSTIRTVEIAAHLLGKILGNVLIVALKIFAKILTGVIQVIGVAVTAFVSIGVAIGEFVAKLEVKYSIVSDFINGFIIGSLTVIGTVSKSIKTLEEVIQLLMFFVFSFEEANEVYDSTGNKVASLLDIFNGLFGVLNTGISKLEDFIRTTQESTEKLSIMNRVGMFVALSIKGSLLVFIKVVTSASYAVTALSVILLQLANSVIKTVVQSVAFLWMLLFDGVNTFTVLKEVASETFNEFITLVEQIDFNRLIRGLLMIGFTLLTIFNFELVQTKILEFIKFVSDKLGKLMIVNLIVKKIRKANLF